MATDSSNTGNRIMDAANEIGNPIKYQSTWSPIMVNEGPDPSLGIPPEVPANIYFETIMESKTATSGSYGLYWSLMNTTTAANGRLRSYDPLPQPGEIWTCSMYVKCSQPRVIAVGTSSGFVRGYDASTTSSVTGTSVIYASHTNLTLSKNWTRIVVTFKADVALRSLQIRLFDTASGRFQPGDMLSISSIMLEKGYDSGKWAVAPEEKTPEEDNSIRIVPMPNYPSPNPVNISTKFQFLFQVLGGLMPMEEDMEVHIADGYFIALPTFNDFEMRTTLDIYNACDPVQSGLYMSTPIQSVSNNEIENIANAKGVLVVISVGAASDRDAASLVMPLGVQSPISVGENVEPYAVARTMLYPLANNSRIILYYFTRASYNTDQSRYISFVPKIVTIDYNGDTGEDRIEELQGTSYSQYWDINASFDKNASSYPDKNESYISIGSTANLYIPNSHFDSIASMTRMGYLTRIIYFT